MGEPVRIFVVSNYGGVVKAQFSKISKFGAVPITRSPSSKGVRSSDYVRCKALHVIFQENKKIRKNSFWKKSYSRFFPTANRKNPKNPEKFITDQMSIPLESVHTMILSLPDFGAVKKNCFIYLA